MLLTSYEMLLKDKSVFLAFGTKWPAFQTVVFDEAHRLKTLRSSTRQIVDSMNYMWLLLLSGAPPYLSLRNCRHLYRICGQFALHV